MFVHKKTLLLFFFISLFLVAGCGDFWRARHDPGSEKFGPGYGKLESTFESINRKIFAPKCVSCHSGLDAPHGIDLSTYEKILNSSVFPPLIIPRDPQNSSLYKAVANNSMPKDRQPLSSAEKSVLYNWILEGALKVPGDDDDDDDKPCEDGDDCEPCDDGPFYEIEEPI